MPQCRHYFQKIILFLGFMLSVSFCFSVQADFDIKIRDFANIYKTCFLSDYTNQDTCFCPFIQVNSNSLYVFFLFTHSISLIIRQIYDNIQI